MKVEESYVICLLLGYILNLFTAEYIYYIIIIIIPKFSIVLFPAERAQRAYMYAILTALNYICNNQLTIFHLVICVDSKSVL